MNTQRLLDWINTHDCGVSPTAVLNADGSIAVRIAAFNSQTNEHTVEEETVTNMTEARNALGY